MVEVEIDGDGVAFRGSNVDSGVAGCESRGGELKADDGTGKSATALGAQVLRVSGDVVGGDLLFAVEDTILEGAPEVRSAKLNTDWRTGTSTSGL